MLKAIKLFLGLLLVSIILISSVLFSGIKINSLSFGNVSLSQFYIKIDKKLIVDIEKISIKSKKSSVTSSYDDLKKNIELFPTILKIFQKIDIRKLEIDGNEFTIALNEEALYLDNKFVNISSKLEFNSSQVIFDIYSLYLKDVELMLSGKAKIDYYKEKLDLLGKYNYKDLNGDITLDMTKDLANFYLNSNEFESLSFLKKFFRLDSIAEAWMYDNVKGKLQLKEFYGSFDLEKNKIIEKSLSGNAVIKNAKIKFNKNAKQISTTQIDVSFKNDKLILDLIEPVYEKIKIDGSYVHIHNLTSERNGLVEVNIKASKAKLDNRILNILKNYNINLPLVQKTGFTNASVNLKIPYAAKKKMDTRGKFILGKSNIDLNGFLFSTNKATVILDNSKVKVVNADIKHKNMIQADLNFTIDTNTSSAKGNAYIKSFLIEDSGDKIVNITKVKTPLFFSYKNDVEIKLDAINTDIKIADLIYVDIKKLSSIYKYSKLLQDINIKNGVLALKIKDENDISFTSSISNLDFPLQRNNKKINSLQVKGLIKKDYVKVDTLDEKIKVEIKNKNIFISLIDTDIVIDTKSSSNKELPILNINAKNAKFKLDNDIYNIVSAKAKISPFLISFSASVKDLDIPIQKEGKKVSSLDIKGTYANNIASIETLDKKIKLKATGSKKLDIDLKNYDVLVNTKNEDESKIRDLNIEGENSTIIVNEKFKFLADKFSLRLRDNNKYFHLNHKKTDFTFKESKDKKIDIFASDISDTFINTIFDKKILSGNNMQFLANGTPESIKGKMILKDVKIEDLAILNNLLLFINTSPALINPLLAIPSVVGMATNGGFNLTGYKLIDGLLEFDYHQDKKILDINRVSTVGNGIDFDGKGKIDLNTEKIDSEINLIFLKDYSKVVGAIPIVNYVLLGKDNRVETKVNIFGALNNPKISTNLTKDAFSVPVNIAKRVLTSPVEFVNFLKALGKDTKEEKK
ncbi:YhdP family protein [Arcobacter peruensis]|uniref:YhdP family protein n=1 Tax=Arcobacter peruensis TaxID=2320140 RepID=UPI001D19369E|nr:AsmA-like C-terminal domain-containing protein [Arcobacter peruensis]